MFASKYRLQKQKDFDKTYKKGRRIAGPLFNIIYSTNELNYNRYAVVVSKKTEKSAVIRNRVKRKLRELIKNTNNQDQGYDIIVSVKAGAINQNSETLNIALGGLIGKIR